MLKDWRAVNALFLTATVLEALVMGHLNAFTPLFLVELGLSQAEIGAWTGFLYASMMAVAFPFAPFWGALAERFSRRAIIVRSYYVEAAALVIIAFAPSVWWVLGARVLLGLTFGNVAMVIATQTILTPRRRMGMAIASIQAAAPVAASLGPPIGAGLIDVVGLRGLFLIDAVLALTAAVLVTVLMPEPASAARKRSVLGRTGDTLTMIWTRRAIRWNFLSWFLMIGSRAIVDVYLPVRIAEMTPDPAPAIGLILGVAGVITAVATVASARLVDDHGGIRWFSPAMIVATLATAGMALVPSLGVVAALTWVRAVPFAFGNTILYGHLSRVLDPTDRTTIMALTPMPRNSAMFALPAVAAAIAPLGVGVVLGLGAVSYLASALTGWLARGATPAEVARLRERPAGD